MEACRGRDHTGVGNFYPREANRKFFDSLGDIGITPVYFEAVGYDENAGAYAETASSDGLVSISGTTVRELIRAKKPLPNWFMREEIQQMFQERIESGMELFH